MNNVSVLEPSTSLSPITAVGPYGSSGIESQVFSDNGVQSLSLSKKQKSLFTITPFAENISTYTYENRTLNIKIVRYAITSYLLQRSVSSSPSPSSSSSSSSSSSPSSSSSSKLSSTVKFLLS